MFFGKVISQGQPFTFTEAQAQDAEGDVLSLTNVVLAPNSKEGGSLFLNKGTEEFLVAVLTKERPQATINLFVSASDEVTLLVKGNAILHVVGFFQPEQDDDFKNDLLEGDEEEEEEQESDEQPLAAAGKAILPPQAKQPLIKPVQEQSKTPLPVKVAQKSPQQSAKPTPVAKPLEKKIPVAAPQEDAQDEDDDDLEEDLDDDEDDEVDDDQDDQEDEDEENEEAAPKKSIKTDGGKPFFKPQQKNTYNGGQGESKKGNFQGGNNFNKQHMGEGKAFLGGNKQHFKNNNHRGGFNKGGQDRRGGFNKGNDRRGGFNQGRGGNFRGGRGGHQGGFKKNFNQ